MSTAASTADRPPRAAGIRTWTVTPAAALFAGVAGYYLLALVCIYLSRQAQGISTMWLPDAFATLWLLVQPRQRRRWLLAAFALTIPAANLSFGDPWRLAVSFAPANLLQVALGAWLIERQVAVAAALGDPRALLTALWFGGGVPALAGATLAALTVPVLAGTPLGPSAAHLWLSWLVSTFFGVATLLPAGLWVMVHGPDFAALRRPAVLAGLAAVVACSVLAPLAVPHPIVYVMVVLVWVALFNGFLAAATAALLASLALNAVYALGGFALARGSAGEALLTMLPILLAVVPTVLIGAIREGLADQLRRTQDGEALQRAMLDASPVLLGLLGADGRIRRMNAAGARCLGVADAQQLVGRALSDWLDSPDAQATLTTPDGRRLRVEQTRVPVRLPEGEAAELVALRDVSDELEMQRLREEAARIEADSRAKSDFLSRMSHELRTPLNAILGFSQLLRATAQQSTPTQRQEQVAQIEQAGWHLLSMIDDVLDLARLESGSGAARREAVPLAPAVAQVVSMLQNEAARAQVTVQPAEVPAGAVVQADPLQLRQVLINLVSNAIKYNRRGGRVDLEVGAASEGWRIEVRDTGVGIRAEQLPHLFEPFNRLDQARSAIPGTGIGLTITQRLVQGLGGQIRADSTAGVGSRFVVVLPAAAAGAPLAAAAPPAAAAAAEPVRRRRVLVVEDEPANRLLVEEALTPQGHELRTAGSAEEALALLAQWRPDLLLVDLRLPGMDGLALRKRLRDDAALAAIPCIALTAQTGTAEREAARALGFVAYLTKPVELRALRRAVAEA